MNACICMQADREVRMSKKESYKQDLARANSFLVIQRNTSLNCFIKVKHCGIGFWSETIMTD